MESQEERQQLEITALKSIYAEDYIECPPPKAWKGALRLPEFIIRVSHPEPEHAGKVFFHLHIKLPKTYPAIAYPTFTIQEPIKGLKADHIAKLNNAIHAEAQRNRGTEMVFQVITFCQDWMANNVVPPVEVVGSLATQMNQRAQEEELAKRQREEEAASAEAARTRALAAELNAEIAADAARTQRERERVRQRERALSDATEMPATGDWDNDSPRSSPAGGRDDDGDEGGAMTEALGQAVEWRGLRFSRVRLFHPRQECIGMTYQAEPILDMSTILPTTASSPAAASPPALELHSFSFVSHYYTTTQGRKKLKQLESEIHRLTTLRHPYLSAVLAARLTPPSATGSSRLLVLCEQRPPVTLQDVLEESEWVREERASDYLAQILSALDIVHSHDLVHRGLSPKCIGLAPREDAGSVKQVKLFRVGYHTRLLDLHRSNPFGFSADPRVEEAALPDGWLPNDGVDSSLVYTRGRDLHALGVVFLQMLMGLNVTDRFPDAQSALRNSSISSNLQMVATSLLYPPKKNPPSCMSVLSDLRGSPVVGSESRTLTMPIAVRTPIAKTPVPWSYGNSPEMDYFRAPPPKARRSSRWKEDWEELELLGRGAFGSVVKARNKIDNRTYAVKKIRLRATQSDNKIFREVNALSRLNHRFIVRYYTTWVETSDPASTTASSASSDSSRSRQHKRYHVHEHEYTGSTSVPFDYEEEEEDPFTIDMSDLGSESRHSFPSIHFTRSADAQTDADETDAGSEESEGSGSDAEDGYSGLFPRRAKPTPGLLTPPTVTRTLYIQMEFVERQTLKERIAEGISEDEAWRLFQQILDALVHMSSLGILHRDIKLTNIFIDGKGDCKVGDFGLATSSLAAVDPSDVTQATPHDADMTLDVGTRLYIAPEVQSSKGGPRNHAKADMYSLGIVFFEMNYIFSTGAERIAVLEDLRKPGIFFPSGWELHRSRQRQIITWLLQHNPDDRPTALELSQSPLLPPRIEDEYFKGALKMMIKADSPHRQAVLSSLFNQPAKPVRGFLYDLEAELPDHATLNGIVIDRLVEIFRLHGAVDMEPPLLMPVTNMEDDRNRAMFLDRHGEVVTLPNSALIPFARLAARAELRRIKRYHVGDIYRPSVVSGHPRMSKAAVFDIITPDIRTGPSAAAAEAISIVNDCLDCFATLGQHYEIYISHSKIFELTLERVPMDVRAAVTDILSQTKSSQSQKRSMLLRKGIARNVVDELEILSEADEDIDALLARLEKISSTLVSTLNFTVQEVRSTITFARASGVTRTIVFDPLMLSNRNPYFKDGVCFEVARRNKRSDVLAVGGRYDNVIARFSPPKQKSESTCAVAVQISLEKITLALAAFQSAFMKTLVKEQRSFGYWSPRRCDVYVVSYQPGYLSDRLEVAALLWQHHISADVMYEASVTDADHENHVDVCFREGILFIVYPRARLARRDQPAFKVKSVLRGTEYEVSRQELVPFLQQQITEQRRIDASHSGVSTVAEGAPALSQTKEHSVSSDVVLHLPGDVKKLRKQTKQMFLDRAFDIYTQVKNSMASGMPSIAIDVPPSVFEEMTKHTNWLTDEDAWKIIVCSFPPQHSAYANQIREAVLRRKADGHKFILLIAVREERPFLLTLC